MTRRSLFLRYCNGKRGGSLFLERGVRRANWDLLLQMSNRTQPSHRLRGPPARAFHRIQLRYVGGSFESFTCQPPAHPPSCLGRCRPPVPETRQSEGKHQESGEGRVLPAAHQVPPLQLEVGSVAFLHLDQDPVAGGLPGHVLVAGES